MAKASKEEKFNENNDLNEPILESTLNSLKDEQIDLMLNELSTFHAIFNAVPFIIMVVDNKRIVRRINKGAASQLEHGEADVIGLRAGDALGCIHTAKKHCGLAEACKNCPIKISMDNCLKTKKIAGPIEAPLEFNTDKYSKKILKVISMPLKLNNEDLTLILIEDVTKEKEIEKRQNLNLTILKTLNTHTESKKLIHEILTHIQEFSGCDSAAIRLHEGDDYPYYVYNGFSKEFIEAENKLCAIEKDGCPVLDEQGKPVLECLCGAVLTKRTYPGLLFTRGGSFWTNSTTELLSQSKHEKAPLKNMRECCNREGYESVALIPLTTENKVIGLLQLNDRRYNRFTADLIEYLEQLGESIGVALSKNLAEQTLKQSEKFLSTILNGIDEGVVVINKDYNIISANSAYLKQTGKKINEVHGQKCYATSHHRSTPCADTMNTCPVTETFKTGESAEALHKHFDEKNKPVWVLVRSHPVKDEKGEIVKVIETLNDVTEIKKSEENLHESEEKLETITRQIPDALYLLDLEDPAVPAKIVEVNNTTCMMNGYTHKELIGKSITVLDDPEHPAKIPARIEKLLTGETIHFEGMHKRKDGTTFPVEVTVSKIIINKKKYAITFNHDISKCKKHEEKLEKTTNELELYSNLLAHDIQNMLQVISGYAEILSEKAPEHKELTEKILLPINKARQTITNIRDLMKAEYETKRRINLNNCLTNTVKDVTQSFPNSTFNLHLPEEELSTTGNEAMQNIFYNLLHNAAIHNSKKVTVNITLKQEENKAIITVEDNGQGINDELIQVIFERGVRDTSNNNINGTGLGLYIVKKLVEGFGGTVTAENSETGAIFTLELPLS